MTDATDKDQDEWLDLKQAAKETGVSTQSFSRMLADGRLTGKRFGNSWGIQRSEAVKAPSKLKRRTEAVKKVAQREVLERVESKVDVVHDMISELHALVLTIAESAQAQNESLAQLTSIIAEANRTVVADAAGLPEGVEVDPGQPAENEQGVLA